MRRNAVPAVAAGEAELKLVGAAGQYVRHPMYRADGTIASGTVAQLVLAMSLARSFLYLQNNSAGPLYFEFGAGAATPVMSGATGPGTNNSVSSVTVTNAGFNFTNPPIVEFLGGGNNGNSAYTGSGQVNAPAPVAYLGNTVARPAKAHAVLAAGAISSIVVDDPGAGYCHTPYVFLRNSDLDPHGCSVPSASSGLLLASGQSLMWNGTACPTEPIAVYGATTSQAYVCRWMD